MADSVNPNKPETPSTFIINAGQSKPLSWVDTCERFVAFLDIMGFKDWVFQNTHESILEAIEKFRDGIIDALEKEAKKELTHPDSSLENFISQESSIVRPVLFSDSIILFSNDNSMDSVHKLLFAARFVLEEALSVGIPIKGAIAYGKLTADFDKSLYLGKPLIYAIQLQEELNLYGIVLHHTLEKFLNDVWMKDPFFSFRDMNLYKYQAPMKKHRITHYVVGFDDYIIQRDKLNGMLLQLYNTVSGDARRYVDNTAEFAWWLRTQRPENPYEPPSEK